MSKVYSAFKCEACGAVFEGACGEGSAILFVGNPRYISIAKEKVIFEDICDACRQKLRDAISTAFPKLRWAKAAPEPTVGEAHARGLLESSECLVLECDQPPTVGSDYCLKHLKEHLAEEPL